MMKDTGKTSQVPLIDFSEPIIKEQDVIREKTEEGGHSCGVDYYLHAFHVKNLLTNENVAALESEYDIVSGLLGYSQ